MRMPIRSESDAFRLTWLAALLVVVAILVGWLTVPWAGVVLFALAAVAVTVLLLRGPDPARRSALREAAHAPSVRSDGRRVLVVANATLGGRELLDRLVGDDRDAVEIDVLAPVLTSRVHLGYTDVDRETSEARERLRGSLAWARAQRIHVRGALGNTSPVMAIEDELRAFGADEVIVVTHPHDSETWQERDELAHLREELDVPVTHIVVEPRADAGRQTRGALRGS
jgi:hypothetical protein